MDTQSKLSQLTKSVNDLESQFRNFNRNSWIIVITESLYYQLFTNQESQFMGIDIAIEDEENDAIAIIPKSFIYNSNSTIN